MKAQRMTERTPPSATSLRRELLFGLPVGERRLG